jgi:hypothetical protein
MILVMMMAINMQTCIKYVPLHLHASLFFLMHTHTIQDNVISI